MQLFYLDVAFGIWDGVRKFGLALAFVPGPLEVGAEFVLGNLTIAEHCHAGDFASFAVSATAGGRMMLPCSEQGFIIINDGAAARVNFS